MLTILAGGGITCVRSHIDLQGPYGSDTMFAHPQRCDIGRPPRPLGPKDGEADCRTAAQAIHANRIREVWNEPGSRLAGREELPDSLSEWRSAPRLPRYHNIP